MAIDSQKKLIGHAIGERVSNRASHEKSASYPSFLRILNLIPITAKLRVMLRTGQVPPDLNACFMVCCKLSPNILCRLDRAIEGLSRNDIGRVWGSGFEDITPRTENQMNKNMESEKESGAILIAITLMFCQVWCCT